MGEGIGKRERPQGSGTKGDSPEMLGGRGEEGGDRGQLWSAWAVADERRKQQEN